jgi:phospholipase/lecithinase/hemolysin
LAPSGVGALANTVQTILTSQIGAIQAAAAVFALELATGVSTSGNPYIPIVAGVSGGTDFAVGGAVTGPTGENAPISGLDGLAAQLTTFQRDVSTPAANALATVSIGGNDVLNVLEDPGFATLYGTGTTLANVGLTNAGKDIAQSVAIEAGFLSSLVAFGVTNAVVMNVPDIGKIPLAVGLGANQAAAGTVLAEYYNSLLSTDIASLNAGGAHIVTDDAFSLINDAIANPGSFGLTNVTSPVYSGSASSFAPGALVSTDTTVQNTFLFFDKEHPTETGQAGLARVAQLALAVPLPGSGLLGGLSVNQQIELIFIAYFNRAADGGGNTFWGGQDSQAQARGQSAAVAISNIANAFAPQPETVAIYSFLAPLVSGGTINLNTPATQAGLTAFIGSVYQNLLNRAVDSAGQNYWVGQITTGAVGLGAAALAIANGATGADAIELQNKIAVALDFTTRSAAANLGETSPLASTFLTAARGVLSGVDGVSLNDASVTAGMAAMTAYIASAATGHQTEVASVDPTVITISGMAQAIDPGAGSHTIQFLAGSGGDTLVLHAGGADQVSGFDPATDVLDLRSLLSEANVSMNGGINWLGNYLTITDQGTNALLSFDPTGHGGGSTIAVLLGLGSTVTGLNTLVADGAIRIG